MSYDPGWFYLLVHLPALWFLRLLDWICRLLHLPSPIYGARGPHHQGCHLVKVVWRSALNLASPPDLDNYMVVHEDWVDEEYILNKDNVTLHGVNRSHVWFSVSTPGLNVYSLNFSFVFLAQHLFAEKLVIMPIESFHKLADQTGDPKVPVTILSNMSRCGSTLICQMLSTVPRVRVMSEPWALLNLQERYSRGQFTKDGYKRLLVSLLRMQCKKENQVDITHILLKPLFCCIPQIEDIRNLLPQVQHIFLFRKPMAAIRSFVKVAEGFSPIYKMLHFSNPYWFYSIPLPPTILQNKSSLTIAQMAAASQLATIQAARNFQRDGNFHGVFTYEDLVGGDKAVDELMDLFNLSDEERCGAVKVIGGKDSQQNTPINQKRLKTIKANEFTLEDFEEIKNCFQMPNLDSDLDMFKKYIMG